MGEKGRAQLVRVERDKILGTVNDINKMRITFAQVTCLHKPLHPAAFIGILSAAHLAVISTSTSNCQ